MPKEKYRIAVVGSDAFLPEILKERKDDPNIEIVYVNEDNLELARTLSINGVIYSTTERKDFSEDMLEFIKDTAVTETDIMPILHETEEQNLSAKESADILIEELKFLKDDMQQKYILPYHIKDARQIELFNMSTLDTLVNKHDRLQELAKNVPEKKIIKMLENIQLNLNYVNAGVIEHCLEVGNVARGIGTLLGKEEEELERLKTAGILHDIGKTGVPEEVLNKNDRLTNLEFEAIKMHPKIAGKLLEDIGQTEDGKYIKNVAMYHHERFDGKGYPSGLAGKGIPEEARIMAVADVFEALTSQRAYKGQMSIDLALKIMEEGVTKGQFDPDIALPFIDKIKTLDKEKDNKQLKELFGIEINEDRTLKRPKNPIMEQLKTLEEKYRPVEVARDSQVEKEAEKTGEVKKHEKLKEELHGEKIKEDELKTKEELLKEKEDEDLER